MKRSFGQYLKQVVSDSVTQIRRAQLPLVASSLSYATILSFVPLLAVSFAIFQAFGGLNKLYLSVEPIIVNNLAEGSSDQVIGAIQKFVSNAHASTLGLSGLAGLIITTLIMLWSVERAINRVWNAPLRRPWFQRLSGYWLFITLGPLGLAVVLGVAGSKDLPIANIFPSGLGVFALVVAVLFCVYKWVPHTSVHSRYAFIAALITAGVFEAARVGYQAYVSHFVSYNKIYGSLAAVPVLLVWIYIQWLVILGGAALTSALQANHGGGKLPVPERDEEKV